VFGGKGELVPASMLGGKGKEINRKTADFSEKKNSSHPPPGKSTVVERESHELLGLRGKSSEIPGKEGRKEGIRTEKRIPDLTKKKFEF